MQIESLSIEDLAALRDRVLVILAEKAPRARKSFWRSRTGLGRWLRQNPPERVLSGRRNS
jgi:hypothetical protein